MGTHEVCQSQLAVGTAHKQRASLLEVGDRLAGEVAVGHQSSAIFIALKRLAVQGSKQGVAVCFLTHQLIELFKQTYPGIQIGGTVVAVNHADQMTIRRSYHVNLLVNRLQSLFQNNHCKYGGSGRYVTGADCHTIGCRHTGSCIALRRAQRNASFQIAALIQQLRAFLSQRSRLIASAQNLRQKVAQLPRISLRNHHFFEFIQHFSIILSGCRVDREHTRSIADAKYLLAGQFPMYISG